MAKYQKRKWHKKRKQTAAQINTMKKQGQLCVCPAGDEPMLTNHEL